MQRYLLNIAYDGSCFSGWQKQPHQNTVQNELEKALAAIAKEIVKTIGSSRTDTGVHALSQFCHFDFPVNLNPKQMQLALRTKLPKSIGINAVYIVENDFHSRYDALARSYRFEIAEKITPFNRNYKSFFPKYPLKPEKIKECLPLFRGKHDFEMFAQKNEELNSYICTVTEISFVEYVYGYLLTITANRFLHNMVRRIIGTVVKLSHDENLYEIISQLLKKNDNYRHLVYTAPPQGLYLTEVVYPGDRFKSPTIVS